MRKLGTVLMWIGAFLLVFDIGAYVTARQFTGKVDGYRFLARANCGKLEEVINSVEQSAWTDAQRKAFDNLCYGPKGFN